MLKVLVRSIPFMIGQFANSGKKPTTESLEEFYLRVLNTTTHEAKDTKYPNMNEIVQHVHYNMAVRPDREYYLVRKDLVKKTEQILHLKAKTQLDADCDPIELPKE